MSSGDVVSCLRFSWHTTRHSITQVQFLLIAKGEVNCDIRIDCVVRNVCRNDAVQLNVREGNVWGREEMGERGVESPPRSLQDLCSSKLTFCELVRPILFFTIDSQFVYLNY